MDYTIDDLQSLIEKKLDDCDSYPLICELKSTNAGYKLVFGRVLHTIIEVGITDIESAIATVESQLTQVDNNPVDWIIGAVDDNPDKFTTAIGDEYDIEIRFQMPSKQYRTKIFTIKVDDPEKIQDGVDAVEVAKGMFFSSRLKNPEGYTIKRVVQLDYRPAAANTPANKKHEKHQQFIIIVDAAHGFQGTIPESSPGEHDSRQVSADTIYSAGIKADSAYYDLGEAIYDIALYAGTYRHKKDTEKIIDLGIEFDTIHKGVDWGVDETLPGGNPLPYSQEYLIAIENFSLEKLGNPKEVKIFYLTVDLNERGEYNATVYDGRTEEEVFDINTNMARELIEDGHLQYVAHEDLDHLTLYLTEMKILPSPSVILSQEEFESKYS